MFNELRRAIITAWLDTLGVYLDYDRTPADIAHVVAEWMSASPAKVAQWVDSSWEA